jgi:predicted AAA+ superfamily ATPase
MQMVQIENGSYNNRDVTGMFPVVSGLKPSAKGGFFLTVNASDTEFKKDKIRVRVEDERQVKFNGSAKETDEEIMDRIKERFAILDEMTEATIDGIVRGMVVSGPPGVGKTFGVEQVLEQDSLFDVMADRPLRHTFVKGTMSPIGLYATLYKYSDAKNIVVLDDCDSILFNEDALNILKAALDSGKKRKISWNSDSHFLRREGVPDQFEFKGSVIFITNLKFDNVKSSKIKDHLEAIMSRCHYLDLTMDTTREKILRIKQIARDGGLFDTKGLNKDQEAEIVQFLDENQSRMREISLRMAQKLADLCRMSPNNGRWKRIAETTCMKR